MNTAVQLPCGWPVPVGRYIVNLTLCLLVLLAGCNTSGTSRRAAKMTDFRVGDIYELRQEAFILAHTGMLMAVQEAQRKRAAEVEALLETGTRFAVRQIILVNYHGTVPRTDVYAEIVSGPMAGRVVNLRTASIQQPGTGATQRDPAVLGLVH